MGAMTPSGIGLTGIEAIVTASAALEILTAATRKTSRTICLRSDQSRNCLASLPSTRLARNVLDVGCGNGFWTGVFQEWDVASYTGVDITDTLFDLLRERHPHLSFMAGDLEQLPLDPGFELITMIDVTQHVTEDAQLRRMLMRLRSLLAKDGVFIVTFWNQLRPQENFYEIFRLFSFYTQALDGMAHTQPIRFRDKFVAAFFHQERHLDQVSPKSLPKASILEIARRIVSA